MTQSRGPIGCRESSLDPEKANQAERFVVPAKTRRPAASSDAIGKDAGDSLDEPR